MQGRSDALAAAARLIQAVQPIARDNGPVGVGTVGELHVSPNSRNTIPGEVRFTIDFRHPDDTVLSAMDASINAIASAESEAAVDLQMIWHNPPVRFDAACVDAIETAAEAQNLPYRRMVSGAGHDACQVARKVPTAMVFVPCRDGLSHNEAEWAEPDHLEAGCNVLLQAALALSRQKAPAL
jgi:N-carbamoyl-L-amino-acid hydrolase